MRLIGDTPSMNVSIKDVSLAGRLFAAGVLVMIAALAVAFWPVQSGTRACGTAFNSSHDTTSAYLAALQAGQETQARDVLNCDKARKTARNFALSMVFGGGALMLGAWVVAARSRPLQGPPDPT